MTPSDSATCPVCGSSGRHLYEKGGHQVYRCGECGLGFVGDLPTPDELRAFYARNYYDVSRTEAGRTGDWGYHTEYGELESGLKRMYRDFLDTVERMTPGKRYRHVLDVGCAYGFFLDVAEERFSPTERVGLDVAPEAEQITARGHAFHRGFVEELELPESHYDLVFMGDAFEHVLEPARVADKLASVLAPGGTLVLTTVDFDAWLARLLGRRWRLMKPPEHLFYWTRRSLTRVFGDRDLHGKTRNYWLYLPKAYVERQFELQFGFRPFFLRWWPGDDIPIWSFDVLAAFLRKGG